jgi:hypothetical protein
LNYIFLFFTLIIFWQEIECIFPFTWNG